MSFFIDHKIISDSQHGFLPQKSTETVLFTFTKIVNETLDRKEYAVGVLLDVPKGFDSLNYKTRL